MNLKDISNEEINKFCKKFKFSLDEFKESYDGTFYLRMFTGYMGPQPEFCVTETSCIGINYFKGKDLTKQWLKFLSEIEIKSL